MGFLMDLVSGRVDRPRLSRWLIALSLFLLTGWLQAHLVLAAVNDDGGTVRNAIAVYNSPDVRAQLGGAADWAVSQGAAITGKDLAPLQGALAQVFAGGEVPPAVAEALVTELLETRDDALAQFAASTPARPLTIEVLPILTAFGMEIPPEFGASIGLSADLAFPILDAPSMDAMRTRYHWAVQLDRWGLLAGVVLGAVGIVLARKPLKALAISLMAGGAVCLAAIPLFGLLRDWLLGGGIGAWGTLLTPLVTSAMAELSPWLLPVGIAAIAVGAGLLTFLIVRERRATRPQEERAIRPSTPWTKDPDSSVENSLASSTASSIATADGTSSL
ncbi:hypothetical protein GCM10009775_00380 [Microbacterium aoyamense]|uniref:Uncharacterized protein n=1 Tax=Microbacterium aoyamense TaxID=344166 RepID=A0ABN2P3S9_9MICO